MPMCQGVSLAQEDTREAHVKLPVASASEDMAPAETEADDIHIDSSPQEDGRESIRWLQHLLQNRTGLRAEAISDEIWQRFDRVPRDGRTLALRKAVFQNLARSSHMIDQQRAATISDTFNFEDLDEPLANTAIRVSLNAGLTRKAVEMHSSVLRYQDEFGLPLETTGLVCRQCFLEGNWEDTLRVLSYQHLRHESRGTFKNEYRPWLHEVANDMQQVHGFAENVFAMVDLISQRRRKYLDSPRYNLAISTIINVFFRRGPSLEQHLAMLQRLKPLRRLRAAFFEKTILSYTKEVENSPEKNRILMRLHSEYCASRVYKPSIMYLTQLLSIAFAETDQALVSEIQRDIAAFELEVPFLTGVKLMRWYNRTSDVAEIRQILAECLKTEQPSDLTVFHSLLQAEATRYGAPAVEKRLEWIKENFDLYPDLQAYQLLLNAYAQSLDLDNCIGVLKDILDVGLQPNAHLIENILNVCARRGDVHQASTYLKTAMDRKMNVSASMYDSVVLAHLNAGQVKNAVRLAHEVTRTAPDYATRVWSTILADSASNKRHHQAFMISRRMNQLEVPFDGDAFAALMRVFTNTRRPEMALGLMRDHMLEGEIAPTALHYAILIEGYASVSRFATAWRLYAHMLKQGIKPNFSTRLALLRLESLSAQHQLSCDQVDHPGVRLDVLEELLEEILSTPASDLLNIRGVQILFNNYSDFEAVPAAMFDSVLSVYTDRHSYEVILTLLEKFAAKRAELHRDEPEHVSLRILYHIMKLRLDQHDSVAVQEMWEQALSIAEKTTRLTTSQSSDLNNPEEQTSLPKVSRNLLASHYRLYVSSLARERNFSTLASSLRRLHTAGFTLDSPAWNLFVSTLVRNDYILEAFQLAESRLLPHFKGFNPWDRVAVRGGRSAFVGANKDMKASEAHTRRDTNVEVERKVKSPGMQFMGRKYEFVFPGDLHVSYDTLLYLRRALINLGDESMGGDPSSQSAEAVETLDQLKETAPSTLRACRDLPALEHGRARTIVGPEALERVKARQERIQTDPAFAAETGEAKRQRQRRKNRKRRERLKVQREERNRMWEERFGSQPGLLERLREREGFVDPVEEVENERLPEDEEVDGDAVQG
ncbi:MAG: hypothetical protein Q9162_006568 [Coniocarpon cinnabarinum]